MKIQINTEQGEKLAELERDLKAAAQTFRVAMAEHNETVKQIEADADSVWQEIATEHEIDISAFDLHHVILDSQHYVVIKPQGPTDATPQTN